MQTPAKVHVVKRFFSSKMPEHSLERTWVSQRYLQATPIWKFKDYKDAVLFLETPHPLNSERDTLSLFCLVGCDDFSLYPYRKNQVESWDGELWERPDHCFWHEYLSTFKFS